MPTHIITKSSLGSAGSTNISFTAGQIQVTNVLLAQISGSGTLPIDFLPLINTVSGTIGYKVATALDAGAISYLFGGTDVFSICAIHVAGGVFIDGIEAAIDDLGLLDTSVSIAAGGTTTIIWQYPQTTTNADNELLYILMTGSKSNHAFGSPSPANPSGAPAVANVVGLSTTGSSIRGSQGLAVNLGLVGPYSSADSVVSGAVTPYTFFYTISIIPLSPTALVPITKSFNFAEGIGYRRRRRPFNPASIDII